MLTVQLALESYLLNAYRAIKTHFYPIILAFPNVQLDIIKIINNAKNVMILAKNALKKVIKVAVNALKINIYTTILANKNVLKKYIHIQQKKYVMYLL